MHQHALWYSADIRVTPSQLKQGTYMFDGDVSAIASWCHRHGVVAFVGGDSSSPFASIVQAPYVVYAMGDVSLLDRPAVAIVGPRKMSSYGQEVVSHIFSYLPAYDVVTISGAADGVDMLCHRLSLENDIPTIVVLGGGIRYYLQSKHAAFLQKVVDAGGLILSEWKIDMKPTFYSFPQRNRIVAGLSTIVCVPEAQESSGSLITVDYALSMHKPVYGAANTLFSQQSAGIHRYLSEHRMQLLYDVPAMLDRYFTLSAELSVCRGFDFTDLQHQIVELCSANPSPIDTMVACLDTDIGDILEALTILEMYSVLFQVSPGIYSCTQRIAK